MHLRSRTARSGLARRSLAIRHYLGGRSFTYIVRVFELCLLAGIILAFAAGMMRIR